MSVLAFTENWDGKFKKISFELISYAHQLAQKMGTHAVALSIGSVSEDELNKLKHYGASKIIKVEDSRIDGLVNKAYAAIIAQVAEKEGANVVVFSHNFTGKALAPRVAVKLKAGVASGVNAVPDSVEPFVVKKGVFTGKAIGHITIKSPIKVLTLFPNSVETLTADEPATIESFTPQLTDAHFGTKVVDVKKVTDQILLTDADVVVSGGRGMKGADKWGPLEELAGLLGAALACSRPVSDEGWRSHHEHVGQTGKVIGPNVYIALGISGAIQHLGGVSAAKHIIAINTDKDAPIFEAAEYGMVADVHQVLPQLVEAVKEAKKH
ncbi:MAG: electron transfer flavoprotein subunit alpha/FixB family protein [Bacteroidales bacterium]|nr:electron transfer flavoprotein subunit alpha/FixB family protein [Bacteroidales bacterium]